MGRLGVDDVAVALLLSMLTAEVAFALLSTFFSMIDGWILVVLSFEVTFCLSAFTLPKAFTFSLFQTIFTSPPSDKANCGLNDMDSESLVSTDISSKVYELAARLARNTSLSPGLVPLHT